jgi:hypothetical protein
MSDTPSFLELQQMRAEAERMRDEAAAFHVAAEKKLADANYALGQAEHRLATVAQMERSISERERKLKELGEPELVAREKAAADKLVEAQELMRNYDQSGHAARLAIIAIDERERAERAA